MKTAANPTQHSSVTRHPSETNAPSPILFPPLSFSHSRLSPPPFLSRLPSSFHSSPPLSLSLSLCVCVSLFLSSPLPISNLNLTRFQATRYASSTYDDVVVDDQDVAAFHVTSYTRCKRVDSARIEFGPLCACSGTRNHIRPASSMTAVQSCLETDFCHRHRRTKKKLRPEVSNVKLYTCLKWTDRVIHRS